MAVNRWVLPTYCTIYAGTATVSDTAAINSSSLTFAREAIAAGGTFTTLDTATLDPQLQRQVTQNWTLDPTSAPEALTAMRCACWWALDGPACLSPADFAILDGYHARLTITPWTLAGLQSIVAAEDTAVIPAVAALQGKEFAKVDDLWSELVQQGPKDQLQKYKGSILCQVEDLDEGYHYDVARDLAKLPPGWLHVGCCKDVPKNACYQAHCHNTYVWVTPDGMIGLSTLTLVLQFIARRNVNDFYFPKPVARKITKTVGRDTVTIYVDDRGRPVSDPCQPCQHYYAVKQRITNTGGDQYLRSLISAIRAR
jgi:hypothetical protein